MPTPHQSGLGQCLGSRRIGRRAASAVAFIVALAVLWPAALAEARVKLITLPVRERVEINLDHQRATLVEEERYVPLTAGLNQVDFSWANTRIDPQTIVFRVLEPDPAAPDIAGGPVNARVLSVSYPPNEQSLVWQVAADQPGSVRVRISYLLGGLTKSFNYRAVADADEATLTLRRYVRVTNNANEAFAGEAVYVTLPDPPADPADQGTGRFTKPIGLSETKELLVSESVGLPVVKTYTCDPALFGYLDQAQNKLNVPMHYLIRNDAGHGLGLAPLAAGKVRIFQRDAAGTTAFLGEDVAAFTPIDGKMNLYLGLAQDIAVTRTVEDRRFERVAGNLFHQRVTIKYVVENFKAEPVTLSIHETLPAVQREARGDLSRAPEWRLGERTSIREHLNTEETHRDRIRFDVPLPARRGDEAEKQTFFVELIFRNHF